MKLVVFSPTVEEWNTLVARLPGSHFLQTAQWAQVKRRTGWQPLYCAWRDENGRTAAAALVLQRALTFGRLSIPLRVIYVPKGPLLDWDDQSLAQRVLDDLQSLARQHGAIFLKIDPDVRLMILCSPHNPVGRVWSRAELEHLGRVALEHDLVVFADEIHHDLVYSGHVHRVFAALSPELAERTVTGIAPSKAFNIPGLSTAAVVASNPGLLEAFKLETERAGYELGQVFGVVGFEAAYAHGGEWLDALLPYLEANVDFLERFLAERVPGIRLVRPEGTYLALLDCRDLGLEPDELNRFFLTKAQVYFSDGVQFGRELEGFVRVNFGCPRALLKAALERIERAVKSLGR